jgi:hypothetical protein
VRRWFALAAAVVLAGCASSARANAPVSRSTTTTFVPAPTTAAPTTTTTTTFGLVHSLARPYPPAPTTGPPNFIWGYGDPLFCGGPTPTEAQQAAQTNADDPPLANAAVLRGQRVLIVGDSSACSMFTGLAAVAKTNGFTADQGVVFGCGIASGEITTTRDEAITPHSSRCASMVDWDVPTALARAQPTLVIWMSIWEKSDLVVNGRTVVAGTPEWEAIIQSRMDAALARLTYGGAKVVIATEPAPAPANTAPTFNVQNDNASYARLNALLLRFAARHRNDVLLVDLASLVCPSGPPCPAIVDGMQVRPDSRHYSPTAAVWAARWLLSQIP